MDKIYNPKALPTLCLLAPNKDVKEKDIWPADKILSTLEEYQFTPIIHRYSLTGTLGAQIHIGAIQPGTIALSVPEGATYRASIFSLDGSFCKQVFNNSFTQGTHTVSWNSSTLAKGHYILKVSSQKSDVLKNFSLR